MSITLSNLFLIQDVQEVARSLGYRCKLRKSKPNAWTLGVQVTEELPVLLARRRPTPGNKQDIMTVEPLGWGKYYGITVDGDSRYCHADYIALRNTGKQGACDFIITVGFDPNMPSTRFIGSTKQKTKRQGVAPMLSGEVFFDGDRGRLRAPRAVTEVDE